jgi:type I restriction enzyme M protein
VDTFEPEEQIDLKTAIKDFQKAISAENKVEKELNELLDKLL